LASPSASSAAPSGSSEVEQLLSTLPANLQPQFQKMYADTMERQRKARADLASQPPDVQNRMRKQLESTEKLGLDSWKASVVREAERQAKQKADEEKRKAEQEKQKAEQEARQLEQQAKQQAIKDKSEADRAAKQQSANEKVEARAAATAQSQKDEAAEDQAARSRADQRSANAAQIRQRAEAEGAQLVSKAKAERETAERAKAKSGGGLLNLTGKLGIDTGPKKVEKQLSAREIKFEQAVALNNARKFAEAWVLSNDITTEDPTAFLAWGEKARAHEGLGESREAWQCLVKARSTQQQVTRGLFSDVWTQRMFPLLQKLAQQEEKSGRWGMAAAYTREMAQADEICNNLKDAADDFFKAGQLFKKNNAPDEAAFCFHKADQINQELAKR